MNEWGKKELGMMAILAEIFRLILSASTQMQTEYSRLRSCHDSTVPRTFLLINH